MEVVVVTTVVEAVPVVVVAAPVVAVAVVGGILIKKVFSLFGGSRQERVSGPRPVSLEPLRITQTKPPYDGPCVNPQLTYANPQKSTGREQRNDGHEEDNRSRGDDPQDPKHLRKGDYSTWGLEELWNELKELLDKLQKCSTTSTVLTREERMKLLAKLLRLVEALQGFGVQFRWNGGTIEAQAPDGRRIQLIDAHREVLYPESLLERGETEAVDDAENVIYGIRCIGCGCNPRRYKYVGLTRNRIKDRAANHLTLMKQAKSLMGKHYESKHKEEGRIVDQTYEVDIVQRVPVDENPEINKKNLRSWEVVYQWLLRTRTKDGGCNRR